MAKETEQRVMKISRLDRLMFVIMTRISAMPSECSSL